MKIPNLLNVILINSTQIPIKKKSTILYLTFHDLSAQSNFYGL